MSVVLLEYIHYFVLDKYFHKNTLTRLTTHIVFSQGLVKSCLLSGRVGIVSTAG